MKVYVDVGACVAPNYGDKEDFCYAIEPYSKTFQQLLETIEKMKQKGYSNIVPVNVALSNTTGIQKLWVRPEGYQDGNSLYERMSGEPVIGYEDVVTLTWDDFVSMFSITRVDVMWMDAEGSEEDVLDGMTECFPEKMFIAYYHRGKFDCKSKEELREQIIEKGYTIVGDGGAMNFIAIKNGSPLLKT